MASLIRPSLSLQRPKSLAAQLAKDLSDRIARGDLKPGDKLPSEHDMVASYGVSRTVVREAVSSLKSAGLASARQGVGVFVLDASSTAPFRIDPGELDTVKEVISLLELRTSLESEAAALAAERRSPAQLARLRQALEQMGRVVDTQEDGVDADFSFHQEIAQATNNRYFIELFAYLGMMAIPRSRIGMYKSDSAARNAYLKKVDLEHQAIFQAIADKDAEGARSAMHRHLSNSRDRLKRASETAGAPPDSS
ncbi:FadR/GntR family transcriptional regulator [Pollutimonas sp. M17]|uniref:FadR/GntR family transcriptional regulator n=1 Tax=Pollutimonas sp. M17 TaxID=2962065 RepID=UPI0021F419E5|nr:FadR/GntR family transcriptional regulator [Pollutimonas sp. M17]UYO94425.1 FadR family transcriptional regulator [Pollutimonas sp. M17]